MLRLIQSDCSSKLVEDVAIYIDTCAQDLRVRHVISFLQKCKNRLAAAFAPSRHFVLVEVVRPGQLLSELDHEPRSQSTY